MPGDSEARRLSIRPDLVSETLLGRRAVCGYFSAASISRPWAEAEVSLPDALRGGARGEYEIERLSSFLVIYRLMVQVGERVR